jgi:hypothetical protein
MTKVDWEFHNSYDQIDHYAHANSNIQRTAWKSHSMKHVPVKKASTQINLGIHENHDWQPIKGPFGPHSGKIICNTCSGKWITWLPKGSF